MENGPTFNWKYGVGFALGVMVTLVVIIVMANKFGKASSNFVALPDDAAAPPPPADTNLGFSLPPGDTQPPPPEGAESYQPAPF